ncbi:hypothetical protein BD410DRAFT_810417 [Rickenella mellea]|uniref:PHD-type domain-containing protein n=1 Tax=Rickenella mellea TaxID=50990 RepID=A0A4Y7PGE2_9AGAM|nr:hypothetical protein BD410DRAFT_810417 [Rickenella mellea]
MPRATSNSKRSRRTTARKAPYLKVSSNRSECQLKDTFERGTILDEYERTIITPGCYVLVQPDGLALAAIGNPHPISAMWRAVVEEIRIGEKEIVVLRISWFYSRSDIIAKFENEGRKTNSEVLGWLSMDESVLTNDVDYIEATTIDDVMDIFCWESDKIVGKPSEMLWYRFNFDVLNYRIGGFKSRCSVCRAIYVGDDEEEQRYCDRCDRWAHTRCLQDKKIQSAQVAASGFLSRNTVGINSAGVDSNGLIASLMIPVIRPKSCIINGNGTSVLAVRRRVQCGDVMSKEMQSWVNKQGKRFTEHSKVTFYICPLCGVTAI